MSPSKISDARLLKLGSQLDRVIDEWLALRKLDDAGETENDEELAAWDSINGRLFPLAKKILAQKAQTRAGLEVQVRAISVANAEWWDGDTEENGALAFATVVCDFLGITPVPMRVSAVGGRA